jgi:hypothetical protein
MNHREPPHLPAGVRKALRGLSLLLLPALALEEGHAVTRLGSIPRSSAPMTPYLPVLGAPALRFQEPAPPPDLVTRPAAGAPPTPALTPTESSVAQANVAAAHSAAVTTSEPTEPVTAPTSEPKVKAPAPKNPSPILPDDVRPIVRPEDFLPYFQLPGSPNQSGDVLLVPVPRSPGILPPSSATYTQTPK